MIPLVSTRIPRFFPARLIATSLPGVGPPQAEILHFPGLNFSGSLPVHFSSWPRALWMAAQPSGVSTFHGFQCCVICKLAESTSMVHNTNEGVDQDWSPKGSLGTPLVTASSLALCRCSPPFGLAIYQVSDPPHNLLIQPSVQQLLYDNLVGSFLKSR